MAIIGIGVDLAKNVFAVHGVDEASKVRLARTVRRDQRLEELAAVPPCIVAMEACSGAHHWARRPQALGLTPRIVAPKFDRAQHAGAADAAAASGAPRRRVEAGRGGQGLKRPLAHTRTCSIVAGAA